MKNLFKKVVCFMMISMVLCSVLTFSDSFSVQGINPEEKDMACCVQKRELEKYNYLQMLKVSIRKNEKKIARLEDDIANHFNKELEQLIQSKQYYKNQESKCSWYDFFEKRKINRKILKIKDKVLNVKAQISKKEKKIKELKKNREKLDNELAIILQNAEY